MLPMATGNDTFTNDIHIVVKHKHPEEIQENPLQYKIKNNVS